MRTSTREATKAPRHPTESQEGGSLRRVIPTAPASAQDAPGKGKALTASYLKKGAKPCNYTPLTSAGILAPPGGLRRSEKGARESAQGMQRRLPAVAPSPSAQPIPGGTPPPLIIKMGGVCVDFQKSEKPKPRQGRFLYIAKNFFQKKYRCVCPESDHTKNKISDRGGFQKGSGNYGKELLLSKSIKC